MDGIDYDDIAPSQQDFTTAASPQAAMTSVDNLGDMSGAPSPLGGFSAPSPDDDFPANAVAAGSNSVQSSAQGPASYMSPTPLQPNVTSPDPASPSFIPESPPSANSSNPVKSDDPAVVANKTVTAGMFAQGPRFDRLLNCCSPNVCDLQ